MPNSLARLLKVTTGSRLHCFGWGSILRKEPGFSTFGEEMGTVIPNFAGENQAMAPGVPVELRTQLLPVARRVFWWGSPEEWLDDVNRFAAQVMTYGDWNDTLTTLGLLGDSVFRQALKAAPPGVFDIKSWTYWHLRYGEKVPPLPSRKL